MRPLYKTTIVVWSDRDVSSTPLHDIGHEADYGDSYCSKQDCVLINKPEDDKDWDGTEFFGDDEDDDDDDDGDDGEDEDEGEDKDEDDDK